ncbi:MAG: tartrate-resistant acid phosphatase type 5 family protein [Acidocella sp.]|nr:tartrate-resistant acid phosphatase type 5 family protein [Acidocella sp.]
MKINRRIFMSSAATLGSGVTMMPAPAQAAPEALRLVLVGDWGRRGHDDQWRVAEQMGRTAQAFGSQYTVSVGDNFYENGVSGLDDPQWQTSFERIYTAPALQTPWKIILGNHDYRGNVQAQLDYSKTSPRWRLPARYYVDRQMLPDGAVADFFFLDTSPFIRKYEGSKTDISGQDSAAQLAWLDHALGASQAAWKIVVGHHPIYTALSDADGYDHDTPDLIARLDPVLKAHDIKLYICGHDHCLQSVQMDGTHYVVNGAGSQTYRPGPAIRGGFASGAHGFMTLQVTAARLDYALIDMYGKTLYARSLTRA